MNPVQINRPVQCAAWDDGDGDPVTVADDAVATLVASSEGNRRGLFIQNVGEVKMWVNVAGRSGMTAGQGMVFDPGVGLSIVPVPQGAVYALADTGGTTAYVIEA